jgi:hypothetical protein
MFSYLMKHQMTDTIGKKNNDIIQEVTTIIPNKAQEDEMFEEKNIKLLEHNAKKKELKVA